MPLMGSYIRLTSDAASRLIPAAKAAGCPQSAAILQALATYGGIITQNSGSMFTINGDANDGWKSSDLGWIKAHTVLTDIEVIDVSGLEIAPSTAQALSSTGSGSSGTSGTSSSGGTAGVSIESHHEHSAARKN